jgi:hypothetical protein
MQGRKREQAGTHLVEVDLDGTDVRGADGDHAEEAVSPTAEECYALVEHEQVLEPARDVGRHAEQVACAGVSAV